MKVTIKPTLQRLVSEHLPEFGELNAVAGAHEAIRHRPDGIYEGIDFWTKGKPDFELKFGFFVSYFADSQPGVFSRHSDPAHLKSNRAWIAGRSAVYTYGDKPGAFLERLSPLTKDMKLVRPFLDRAAQELLADPLLSLGFSLLSKQWPADSETARLFLRDSLIQRGVELKLPVSKTRDIRGIVVRLLKEREIPVLGG